MEHSGFTIVGVVFWVFLAVSAVAGIIADYKKRRLELEPLRAAIERGQQLDPATVERLMRGTRPEHGSELDPLSLRVGGIITVASGIGIGLLSFFINAVAPIALYPLLGVGVVAVCVGVGLMLSARTIERYRSSRAPDEAGA